MGTSSRPRRVLPHPVLLAVVLALLVLALLHAYIVGTAYVPSPSMEPLLRPGDRVIVSRVGASVPYRGEVVLFDATTAFGIGSAPTDYVKRVIGVGGDQVRCCAADGRIEVDGVPITEPYLAAGDVPSAQRFDVRVPRGHVFVLGDHRSDSDDSRDHLGDPGGGMVPDSGLIGRVVLRYWPPGRLGTLPATSAFADVP